MRWTFGPAKHAKRLAAILDRCKNKQPGRKAARIE